MNCKEAKRYMHEYLDGERDDANVRIMLQHVRNCAACRKELSELEKTEAMVRNLCSTEAPSGLTSRIIDALPREKRQSALVRWIRRHPAVSVAAVFLLVMVSSLLSLWNQDQTLVVRGENLDQVEIYGSRVVVPEGSTISGSLTVENGELEVFGEVKGDLIVIDGNVLQASTAQVSGKIIKVNQAIDWIWYKMSQFVQELVPN